MDSIFISYRPPEWFLEHNKNKEFNLHNLGEDAPAYAMRTIGYALVSITGIIAPVVVWLKDMRLYLRGVYDYFIPSCWIIVPSLFHLFANLPKAVINLFPGGSGICRYELLFCRVR